MFQRLLAKARIRRKPRLQLSLPPTFARSMGMRRKTTAIAVHRARLKHGSGKLYYRDAAYNKIIQSIHQFIAIIKHPARIIIKIIPCSWPSCFQPMPPFLLNHYHSPSRARGGQGPAVPPISHAF
jgi:hypothetical protein